MIRLNIIIFLLSSLALSQLWASAGNNSEGGFSVQMYSIQINFNESSTGALVFGGKAINKNSIRISSRAYEKGLQLEFKSDLPLLPTANFVMMDMQNFPIYKIKKSSMVLKDGTYIFKINNDDTEVINLMAKQSTVRFCYTNDVDFIIFNICSKKILLTSDGITEITEKEKENKYFINEKEVGSNGSLFLDNEKSYVRFLANFSTGEKLFAELSKPRIESEVQKQEVKLKIVDKNLGFQKNVQANVSKVKKENKKLNIKLYDNLGIEFLQKITMSSKSEAATPGEEQEESELTGTD